MLTDIFRDVRLADALSAADVTRLRQALTARAKSIQQRMKGALAQGDLRKFKHLCSDGFRSSGMRLWAHFKALPDRPAAPLPLRLRVQQCASLDPFSAHPRPLRWQLPKSEPNQYRDVFEFEPLDQARFYLVKLALDAIARAHPTLHCTPSQTLSFGGRSTACNILFQALQTAPREACFVQIDVRSFYPSIASEYLEKVLPLPREVIHRCILTAPYLSKGPDRESEPTVVLWDGVYRGAGTIRSSTRMTDVLEAGVPPGAPHTEGRGSRRRFVPTGSATASIAGEIAMGGALGRVDHPEGVLAALVYSDNIGVLCANRASAGATADAYTHELERYEGGPFRVRCSIRPIGDGFPFLGYIFRSQDGRVIAQPRPEGRQAFELRWSERILRTRRDDEIRKAIQALHSYVAAFPLWTEGSAYLEERLTQL